jgi:uncharacterized protein YndB with AHSA1/START domain
MLMYNFFYNLVKYREVKREKKLSIIWNTERVEETEEKSSIESKISRI